MIKKTLITLLITSFCIVKPYIIVEIINNSSAGIKAIYEPIHLTDKAEQFIESKKSYLTPKLEITALNRGKNIYQVLIKTYKGPLKLVINTKTEEMPVPVQLRRRGPLNRYVQPTESVINFDITAELSAEYPIAHARFTSGRPWDEYKVQVIIDEKQIENSKVSIAYKPLEKTAVRLTPLSRPAPARRLGPLYQGSFDEQGSSISGALQDIPGMMPPS